jgi:hypothetical protein
VALERCKAHGEDVALVLADQWMELVAQLYRRGARYGGEDASRVKAVWGLAEITNRPTGLIELGPAPHVPACGQAYSVRTRAELYACQKAVEYHRSPTVNDLENKPGTQTVLSRSYLASLPERTARAGAALTGGLVYETGEVLLPLAVRRSKLYQAVVGRLLRITIELVGGVDGVYPTEELRARELLVRKTAGNVIELGSFLAVGWSPVWLLAGASDLIGGTNVYLRVLATELRDAGVLSAEEDVASFEELLTALEGTSGVLADTVDVPPLNVDSVRTSWQELRRQAADLPDAESLEKIFSDLQLAAQQEDRSVMEISSVVALGAVHAGVSLGNVHIFDYYRSALRTIADEGLLSFLRRTSTPYLTRARSHFDPRSVTYSERLLRRWAGRRSPVGRQTRSQTQASDEENAARR